MANYERPQFLEIQKQRLEIASRAQAPIALVMSYSFPDAENRVKFQIKTLLKLGFEVHTLGWGSKILPGVTRHIKILYPVRTVRVFREVASLALLRPKHRFRLTRLNSRILREIKSSKYSLVINHDLELLPLLCDADLGNTSFEGALRQLDLHELHEYTPTLLKEIPLIGKLLEQKYKNYQGWLFGQISNPNIDLHTVVGKRIGAWYSETFGIKNLVVVRNVSPFRTRAFQPRIQKEVRFIHHGKYTANRGLEKVVRASKSLKDGDSLTFLLNGDIKQIEQFKSWAQKANPKIEFLEPVQQEKVSSTLSNYDVEIILFEPVTENLRHTLPNKVFEAIQGDLALIVGPNPDLAELVNDRKLGEVLENWSEEALSFAIEAFDRAKVERFRRGSYLASGDVSQESESQILENEWIKIWKYSD